MRKKTLARLRVMIDELITPILDGRLRATCYTLGGDHERILKAVTAVQPVNVELDQELADRIVEKMHGPLTIPAEMSQWVKDEAQYHDMQSFHRLGYSKMAADVLWTLQVNGTIRLEIKRVDGSRWWSGTFVPPDFGKAP